MTALVLSGILSGRRWIARHARLSGLGIAVSCVRQKGPTIAKRSAVLSLFFFVGLMTGSTSGASPAATTSQMESVEAPGLQKYRWDFSRTSDKDFDDWPDGWKRYSGIGLPKYVMANMAARDPELEKNALRWDAKAVSLWSEARSRFPTLPPLITNWMVQKVPPLSLVSLMPLLPPSITDMVVDRYLKIELDGGQFKAQSPSIPASTLYQYKFSCQIMTHGLHHDLVRAKLIFLDQDGNELSSHATERFGGTTKWTSTHVDLVRPPASAKSMLVRVMVERSEDGLEDIRGTIGFDNVRIERYPQLQVTTDQQLGIYSIGAPVIATAKIMGVAAGESKIRFRLFNRGNELVATELVGIRESGSPALDGLTKYDSGRSAESESIESDVSWTLPQSEPGFYRIAASIEGRHASTLASTTTFAVIDELVGGPPHGPFGWSLPRSGKGLPAKQLARWMGSLGVAWVKYPCWIGPDDTEKAEEIAVLFGKLQDEAIQTVGVLDVPPEDQLPKYDLRGRRDLVAAQLFRNVETWQPQLEPVMTRLTLKVRRWQLGADRDYSFLGRPRLRETIAQISSGLQGFGQPIDVAISWPWLEQDLDQSESVWQAVCRSSDPPLSADELDSLLNLDENDQRGDGPRTWMLLDPIARDKYGLDTRISDLVLRMAMVRSHRVQAAFVRDPRDPQQGLLRPDGRPDELLLPWRTTSRLIGDLRKVGSLNLRSKADNAVFIGSNRTVLMMWSPTPTEETMYLGEHVQMVDVWGKVTDLPIEPIAGQPAQRIPVGRVPVFIIGADPTLIAFRMSVDVEPRQFDSLLGQIQPLKINFNNPTRDSLVGTVRVFSPATWEIGSATRSWEALPGRPASETFEVVLGNTSKIGDYELPIQFELDTVPPKLITVYRKITVGPEGLEVKATTRLLAREELRVRIEISNRSSRPVSYDCLLFPPPGRQYQRRFVTIDPGETIFREFYWPGGGELIGKKMLLRAIEQDGNRVLNYPIEVLR